MRRKARRLAQNLVTPFDYILPMRVFAEVWRT